MRGLDRTTISAVPQSTVKAVPQSTVKGCPPPVTPDEAAIIEWVDFINLDGREYGRLVPNPQTLVPGIAIFPGASFGPMAPVPGDLTRQDLGERVGVVCYRLSDLTLPPDYQTRSGDAGFLPVGTELRALEGYAPWFRVGAMVRGGLAVYELVDRPDAETGADLFDISGKVRRIAFLAGRREPAAVTDPQDIRTLVDALLAAKLYPVEHRIPEDAYGTEVRLRFFLDDGTIVQRGYFPDADLVNARAVEPPQLQQAYDAATTGR